MTTGGPAGPPVDSTGSAVLCQATPLRLGRRRAAGEKPDRQQRDAADEMEEVGQLILAADSEDREIVARRDADDERDDVEEPDPHDRTFCRGIVLLYREDHQERADADVHDVLELVDMDAEQGIAVLPRQRA